MREGGSSEPPFSCSGPVLVCGNAFNLHEDLELAQRIYNEPPVIVVNGAAGEVDAFALFSVHPERFISRRWIQMQQARHDEFTVHASKFHEDCPHVDHWWEGARGKGGSAWGARKMASLMGFDLVVLVGCPLEVGGYSNHGLSKFMSQQNIIDGLRQGIEDEPEWHKDVLSMSGWTAGFLGSAC